MSLLWSANGAFPFKNTTFIENISLRASYFYFTINFERKMNKKYDFTDE